MAITGDKPVYLAADCGGSTCRVRLYDRNGLMLAEGHGGAANAARSLEPVMSEIFRATRQALDKLTGETIPLSRLHAGFAMAGLVDQGRRDEFVKMPHPFASMTAETDAFVAQLGAFAGGDGGVLITGTGSCAFGVKGAEKFYIGGWGFQISDQGSGARLGYLALRRAVQAADGILPTSPFCKALLKKAGGSPPEVSRWALTATPADYGAFAGLAFDYAVKQDEVAISLIKGIAAEIDQLTRALVKRGIKEVHHVGGLAKPVRPWLDAALARHAATAEGDVFDGALRLINNRTGLINKTGTVRA
tara:strand:+ start:1611 stop:2522 length:912 start_codon:yes stop_codon:yes gene_type:complete